MSKPSTPTLCVDLDAPLVLEAPHGRVRTHRLFATRRHWTTAVLKALRPHQWSKNALVFVPLIMAQQIFDGDRVVHAILACVAFSLLASSVYVANDLLDLQADRLHPTKRLRPFAAGDLSIATGILLSLGLLAAASIVAALVLPSSALLVLAVYGVVAAAYSVWLKRIVVADVVTLASLYVLRVVAGGLAVAVPLSHWLLAFSMFIFLSLALMKRYAELTLLRGNGRTEAAGRGYCTSDLEWLGSTGTASGYLSVLVLALYVTGSDVGALYRSPAILWPVCVAVLYWITRMWALTYRGSMHDDPVVATLKDPVSHAIGVAVAIFIACAALV
jgi:4-hydroxybenzoate polyprenyltransferase